MKQKLITIIGIPLVLFAPKKLKVQKDYNYIIDKKFIRNRTPMHGNPGFFFRRLERKEKSKIKFSDQIINIYDSPTVYGEIDFSELLQKYLNMYMEIIWVIGQIGSFLIMINLF